MGWDREGEREGLGFMVVERESATPGRADGAEAEMADFGAELAGDQR